MILTVTRLESFWAYLTVNGRFVGLDGDQWASLWSGVVGSLVGAFTALAVVLLSNRQQAKSLRRQLDEQERSLDRQLEAQRESVSRELEADKASVERQLEVTADEARMRGFEAAASDVVVSLGVLPHVGSNVEAGEALAALKGALIRVQLTVSGGELKNEMEQWRTYFHSLEAYRWHVSYLGSDMAPIYSSEAREKSSRWLKVAREVLEQALIEIHATWHPTDSDITMNLSSVRRDLEVQLREVDGPIATGSLEN